MAESAAGPADGEAPRPRRSGGKRPNTIVAACKEVLLAADEPMRVADITERVVAMGTPVRAKNPNVTVSSILSSYDDFIRVRRGYYQIAPGATPAGAEGPAESDPGPELATRAAVDVLADLRAAAAEQDRAEDSEDLPRMDLEAFGATR